MFVPINGFEDYYTINEEGIIYSIRSKRLLKPFNHNNGYLTIELCVDGLKKRVMIHRLVAQQFLPNPNNYPIIDHIDRNKHNNDVKNLRWTTASVNNRNRNRNRTINKTIYPNIYIRPNGTYKVVIMLDYKYVFNKTFKTLDEALSERDCAFDFLGIENNCYK